MDSLLIALKEHYGWNSFRTDQRIVVEGILSGKDVLAVLPTGGGKSLCYQLPALVQQGLVVVISPLIALMEDQVMKLQRRGICAVCIHAGLNAPQRDEALLKMEDEKLRLLYLSPERIQSYSIRRFLQAKNHEKKFVAIAIDEAHCISAWGHNFRPLYRKLGDLRHLFPEIPLVALTATAAPRVRADIIRLLNLHSPLVQVASARRNNLKYCMQRRPDKPLPKVLEVIEASRGANLIYVRKRSSVDYWVELLKEVGIDAIPYHAGLSPNQRNFALKSFLAQPKPVLVATIAFGMGVDRGDVGLVLHLNLPATPEGYLQESGRAGRDGLPADCVVLFSPGDRTRLGLAIKNSSFQNLEKKGDLEDSFRLEYSQQQLRKMEAIAEGENCREQALLQAIGEIVPPCGQCDICRKSIQTQDWSQQAMILLSELEDNKGISFRNLINKLSKMDGKKQERWGWLTRRLVEEELIRESNDGNQNLYLLDSGRCFKREPWPLVYVA